MGTVVLSRLAAVTAFVVVTAVAICPLRCAAQSNASSTTPSSAHSPAEQKSPEKTSKLTPEQERGLRLLKAAEAEAAGLQPDMRAFVLWRASNAYAGFDPKKADKVSEDAFIASEAMDDPREDDRCAYPGGVGDIKGWIQQQVLYEKVRQDKISDVERLLPQATSHVRNEITAELVRHYIAKKDFSRAEAFLSELAESDWYPFGAAAELLLDLGPEQTGERTAIFNEATRNYEQHTGNGAVGSNDIGKFLERTWAAVPPALALDAVERVLERTKSQEHDQHYSMSTAKGSLVLNSGYQLRLFELLPILEELDKDKAETLLRDNTEIASQLQKYPKGLASISNATLAVGSSDTPIAPMAAQQQLQMQLNDQVAEVLRLAASDPATALANALLLPVHGAQDFSPRAQALVGIAEAANKKKPTIAKSALDQAANLADQLSPHELRDIANLPQIYVALGDADGAKKAIAVEVKAAERVYEHDTDADDPNGAFKGTWPSTDLWRKCIQQAAKVSPTLAEEIMAGIQDPDIATLEKMSYATALLGSTGTTSPIAVADCRKTRSSYDLTF